MNIIKEYFDEEAIKLADINSLLLDSGTIAELYFEDGSYCDLAVRGEKSVIYKDEYYYYVQDYPEELFNLIKADKGENDEWRFWDNNWIEFEYFDKDDNLINDYLDGDVVDGEFGNTKESAKSFMLECKRIIDEERKQK